MAIKLNKREKISVAAATAAIAMFILLQFLVLPLFDENARLSQLISTRQKEFDQIRVLQAEYRQTAKQTEQAQRYLKTRKRGFTLFSFLETLAGKTGVKSRISYMKPSSTPLKDSPYRISMVEMLLKDITMPQLLSYLHGIETSRDMIAIKRLSISKGEQQAGLINTVFQVETLEK